VSSVPQSAAQIIGNARYVSAAKPEEFRGGCRASRVTHPVRQPTSASLRLGTRASHSGLLRAGSRALRRAPQHWICASPMTVRLASTPIVGTEPDKLAARFPPKPKLAARFPPKPRPEETPLRKQFVISASSALIITSGLALAQHETPQQYDKSSAPSGLQSTTPDKAPIVTLPEANTPAPETTGQAPNFEDRWSAQGEAPDRLPTATMPSTDAPRATDQPRRSPLDQRNGNWDPPPVTAPSTQR
jgi:hypothetical protein